MEKLTLKDFFTARNIVRTLDEGLYRFRDGIVDLAEAFARNFSQPVFIIDFYRQNLFYISDNLRLLFGQGNTHFDYLSEAERDMHLEIVDKAMGLLYTFPQKERHDWTLSYSFYVQIGEKRRLMRVRASPLYLTPEGKVWLALCSLSLSSRKEAGHPTLRNLHFLDYYKYSFRRQVWLHKEGINLTDIEKEILIMSSQGYIMKEIAGKLGKSVDSIKFYKRQMFFKMGVENITEAVFTAHDNNLLH